MNESLLATKLFVPPPRAELVARLHLLERLNAGCQCRLALVCAPAGFGKTTLLASWLREARLPVAWVSLDAGDNEPGRFWAYVFAALERLQPGLGETPLALLHTPQPPAIEAILTALINDLAAAEMDQHDAPGLRAEPYVLVLDDYHTIEAQAIHAGLAFLLDHLPAGLCLVVATRADPPLPLARFRARGQLLELRATDLRFTAEETADLFNRVMGLSLAANEIATLEDRTEGWIAGLHLAAQALQGIPPGSEQARFVQDFGGGHHYVLDYLVEEVLSRQPPHVRAFLQETAILKRLTASLCDAVTGRDDGQTVLLALDQANLFLVPLDSERRWYRYHHLLADLLRVRSGQDDDLIGRHRRAAGWYQTQGLTEEAFGHWLQAGAFAEAATLVENQALAYLNQGQTTPVLAWIEQLPPDLVASRPWLLVARAWGLLLSGQAMAVPACLHQVQAAAETPLADPDLIGQVAAIQAYLTILQGDIPGTIALAQKALEHLSPQNLAIRSVVAFVLGGTYLLAGDLAAALTTFAEAAQMGQAADNRHVAVPAWCAVANLQATQGRLRQAEATYQQALDLALTSRGRPLPLAAQPYEGLAQVAYERNDLTAASELLDKSLELCRQAPNPETTVSSLVAQATLCLARDDLEAAEAACEEALAVADGARLDPLSEGQLVAKRAELLLIRGNVAAAARLVAGRHLTTDDDASFVREREQVALARISLAQGRTGEALTLLARLAAAAQEEGRIASLVKLLTLQATAYQVQRKMEQAHQALSHALSLAEPEGLMRAFLDEGQPLAGLLGQLPAAPYRDKLLDAFDVQPPAPDVPLIEPLSDRELEVLHLIATGSSNRAIAEALVLALGTVKAHTAAIYRKLDVNSRTQAVARARELGLFD